jgi:predicted transcriptional regulator
MRKFEGKLGLPGREISGHMPAGRTAVDVAEDILEFLGDGKLHELKEIANAAGLSKKDVKKILDFFTQVGLVERGMRITDFGFNFLKLPVEG